ncbi:MAG: hypothetical protein IJ594_01725, partial [Oscillospiraceae bacterium]|nr:hypothetical protein [Oscillospiraceae bacterium]
GRVHLQPAPQTVRGAAYRDGALYLAADDGDAWLDEPDHLYRARITAGATSAAVVLERTLDDVIFQGAPGGLDFDAQSGQLLLLYVRPPETAEVFTYDVAG